MAQVIIYSQNGQVAVCTPTGELPIEEVLVKDCPEGAIIVDDSVLPQGEDDKYFDAWELIDGKVVVNATKKSAIQAKQQTRQSALNKLMALGLTEEEALALGVR